MFKAWSELVDVDVAGVEVLDLDLAFSPEASATVGFSPFSRPFRSKAPAAPGVFGVLTDPKEANAPDPKPKAEDAPAEGEFVVNGEMVLKGLDFAWEDDSPARRLLLEFRGESNLPLSLLSGPMDRESLPLLVIVSLCKGYPGVWFDQATYLDLRVHKFALSMKDDAKRL